jgi:hypothetical protein
MPSWCERAIKLVLARQLVCEKHEIPGTYCKENYEPEYTRSRDFAHLLLPLK